MKKSPHQIHDNSTRLISKIDIIEAVNFGEMSMQENGRPRYTKENLVVIISENGGEIITAYWKNYSKGRDQKLTECIEEICDKGKNIKSVIHDGVIDPEHEKHIKQRLPKLIDKWMLKKILQWNE